jgi:Leucine-rich repeat (LRR) protein
MNNTRLRNTRGGYQPAAKSVLAIIYRNYLTNTLSNLTSLQTLDLRGNDISSLAYLTSLQTLDFSRNYNLGNISPLANLTSLKYLNLSRNYNVTDISPLVKLKNTQIIR